LEFITFADLESSEIRSCNDSRRRSLMVDDIE
jgi:hypothetical protein